LQFTSEARDVFFPPRCIKLQMCHTRKDLEAAERPGAAGPQPSPPGGTWGGSWWVRSQQKAAPRGPDPHSPTSEGAGRAGSGPCPDRCGGGSSIPSSAGLIPSGSASVCRGGELWALPRGGGSPVPPRRAGTREPCAVSPCVLGSWFGSGPALSPRRWR